MKTNKFTEFFKGKGYYVLLFVGVLAIAAVAVVGSRLSTDKDNKGEIDLNEPDNNIASEEYDDQLADNDPSSNVIVNKGQSDNSQTDDATNDLASNDTTIPNDDLIEFAEYPVDEDDGIGEANNAANDQVAQNDTSKDVEVPTAVETTGKTVQAQNTPVKLSFNINEGLMWPVQGNVIMKYSTDHTIYHPTLKQFKINPAIIIDAELGTEVKAATKSIVTDITNNEVTGLTVTTDIGDGYNLVYGQLENVNLQVGDRLDEGEVIGTIAAPSKYYSVEGSNLYFQVLQDGKTVNPMLFLR